MPENAGLGAIRFQRIEPEESALGGVGGRSTDGSQRVRLGVPERNISEQERGRWPAKLIVHTENSVRINQHTCGTLIADLVDALSLLASTSQSKDWKSLPRPVVECIKCWEFVSRKKPVLISKNFVRLDQGEAAFPLRKANVEATGLLRLSGASLISVV